MNHNSLYHFRKLIGKLSVIITCSASLSLIACQPAPITGPDQTVTGGLTGATLGGGAGMVVGHQIGHLGAGGAVGAGFGLIGGALTGMGHDRLEQTNVKMQNELDALRASNSFNRQQIEELQDNYDKSVIADTPHNTYQVFFDDNATSLKAGAVSELERIAEILKTNRAVVKIEVAGHTDETGSQAYNMQLSEARAQNTATYLKNRGISIDQIEVKAYGSSKPIATNSSDAGRQLNRRVEIKVLK